MTYSLDYMAFVVSSVGECDLARAAAKASSCNGFGCARDVWPLQVLVRVVGTCAMACPVVRWVCGRPREGATPWASGVIATNDKCICRCAGHKYKKLTSSQRNGIYTVLCTVDTLIPFEFD